MVNHVRAHVLIFNSSCAVCGAFLYSTAYSLLKPTGAIGASTLWLPAAIMGLTSFLISTALAAIRASWTESRVNWEFWAKVHLPLVANFFLAAAGATFIVVWHDHGPYVPLAGAPVVALTWGWTKAYLTRVSQMSAAQ